ncbi:protein kinase [Streptomyces sp. NBC_01363]|uniref:serine/threonine-protein kinase n=1 Tax=Streptomyces sp. NBC_01363 TaxID=2903840 RepID=UPI00225591D0|nr:serine/threonine-protein kinase [Streptomyces sp. NBC_01363]MCX4734777.1 serine/threonine-protein kinase [Streptomyces sp. NBC_01363]
MIERLAPNTRTRIGPYRILGLLGAGGMGEVYLARPAGEPAGGLVALKTVRADLDLDDGFRVRFRREIEAAAAVRSPRTATLVGGDATGRTPWLATEYVPGPSLAEAVARDGPLPEPVVRTLGAGLARGLADMHAVRVLHRDLKPGNVLLGPDGPKVIDFGIAQAFDATQLTRTGVVVGSPGYISPEHVNGSRALVPASDVFCLASVLAFAAAGRGPFDDSDMAAVIFRIARGEAELSGVPTRLREVIVRCLDPRPEQRPAPRELAALLLREQPSVPFPWTPGVRAQQAAYERAARECAGAAPAEPAPAPVVPPLPAGPPLAAAAVSGAGTSVGLSRRKLQVTLTAVAVTVCLLLGYLFWPDAGPRGGGTGAGSGSTGPGAGPANAGGAAGVRAVPRADSGRTGDFGKAATDLSARPAGWKAWQSTVEGAVGGCSLAESTLLCGGTKGVTALDAADGKQRWQTPKGAQGATAALVAGFTKGTVYAFVGHAMVGYRIKDGAERWRAQLPAGDTGSGAVQDGDTLYYATRDATSGTGRLAARRLTGDRGELWNKPYAGTRPALVADDGRLVVVEGSTRIVDGATGTVKEQLPANDFPCRDPALKGRLLVCRATGTGVAVMNDVTRPQEHRIIAEDITVRYPVALTDDGTVVVNDGDHPYAFDAGDGRSKWSGDRSDEGGEPSVAGDQILSALDVGVSTYRRADGEPTNITGYTGVPNPPKDPPHLLAAGDVVFLTFDDGTVVSGYIP